jgi:hypothetical protein
MVEPAVASCAARVAHSASTSFRVRGEVAATLGAKREKALVRSVTLLMVACLSLALVPACVQAQPLAVNPTKSIADDDLKEYCIFNDRLYSVGAFICAAKRLSLQCERPDKGGRASWKSVASPDCEPNQSLTPQ